MRHPSVSPRGSALVYGLIIMTAVSIILTGIIGFIASNTKYGIRVVNRYQAFEVAEAGVYFYRWYLAHSVEGKTAEQIQDFWESTSPYPYGVDTDYEAEYSDPSLGPIGRYRITVDPPAPGSTSATVTSVGWTYKDPDQIRTIRVRFRRPAWSEYMMLTHNAFRLSAQTLIYGKIHSNTGMRYDGVVHNTATASTTTYYDTDTGQNKPGVWTSWPSEYNSDQAADVFQAGKEYPVSSLDFAGILGDLSLMKSEAQDGNGRYFDNTGEGRQIILKNNGTYDMCIVHSYNPNFDIIRYRRTNGTSGQCSTCTGQCAPLNYPIVNGGVIFVEDNVWVEGQINGNQLTVAAANLIGGSSPSVYLHHDIRYTNYDGTDILGIVAQKDIELAKQSDDNLILDGAYLAQTGRFGRNYYAGHVRDSITINGAIASFDRVNFGYTDGTGYVNRIFIYDNNLHFFAPPFFPTGTQYRMDLWEEL